VATIKTQRNDGDVDAFLATVGDDTRREDARAVCDLMAEVTGDPPEMWGDAIVGFGDRRYRNGTGKVAEWFVVGFSPRKLNLTLYIMDGFEQYDDLLGALGKHTTGKSCLYVKRLADVDLQVLKRLVETSVAHVRATSLGPDET